jgi:hypothetical protein
MIQGYWFQRAFLERDIWAHYAASNNLAELGAGHESLITVGLRHGYMPPMPTVWWTPDCLGGVT